MTAPGRGDFQGPVAVRKRFIGIEALSMADVASSLNQLAEEHYSVELISVVGFFSLANHNDVFGVLAQVTDVN